MHESRDPSLTLVNVDCCTFMHSGPADGKAKKRSQSPFSYIAKKIKDTTGKHRAQSKERLDKTGKIPGQLRTPDITLAAGHPGSHGRSLGVPQSQQSLSSSTELSTATMDNDGLSPRVAFGFDPDQYGGRSSSAETRVDEGDTGKNTLFDMFSEFHYAMRIFPGMI